MKAIAMSSKALGAAIKAPTARITRHAGNARAHEVKARTEREEGQEAPPAQPQVWQCIDALL
jgi:hypothetical protein